MTCQNPEVRGGAIPLLSLTAGGCPSRLRFWGHLFSILFSWMISAFTKTVVSFIQKLRSARREVSSRHFIGSLPLTAIVTNLHVYGLSRRKPKQLSLLTPQNSCWCASGERFDEKSCMHMEFRAAAASGARGSTGRLVSHVEVK